MSDLRDILARTLAAQGALVEPIHPDGLEICAPPHVQAALALPEWSRVGFGTVLPPQAIRVSFEAEWAQRLMRLLGDQGTYAAMERPLSSLPPVPDGLESELTRTLVLENATYRLREVEPDRNCYFLLVFRVNSTSDDKREDTLFICINESSGAAADRLVNPLVAALRDGSRLMPAGPIQSELPLSLSAKKLHKSASRVLPAYIRTRLAPFLAGMERRMSRDLERLHTYYGDLRAETAARIENKKRKGEESKAIESEQSRMQAIEREYHAKVEDLNHKYAVRVDVELTQAVRAQLPVWRADFFLLRRKGIRKHRITWNPWSRTLDPLPCEACFFIPKTYYVCDDKLHLVCSACMAACPSCARVSCRACHPAKCPKCGHAWQGEQK